MAPTAPPVRLWPLPQLFFTFLKGILVFLKSVQQEQLFLSNKNEKCRNWVYTWFIRGGERAVLLLSLLPLPQCTLLASEDMCWVDLGFGSSLEPSLKPIPRLQLTFAPGFSLAQKLPGSLPTGRKSLKEQSHKPWVSRFLPVLCQWAQRGRLGWGWTAGPTELVVSQSEELSCRGADPSQGR